MRNAYFLLHGAILLAGFTGVFGKLITLNEGLLTWYRVLISSVALFFLLKITRTPFLKSRKEILEIVRVGLLLTVHWLFFYGSIKYSNVSIGVVCFALTSCFTAILVPFIRKTPFVLSELLLSAITILGISLIFHFDASHQTGIILGVFSAIFSALYTIFNEKLVQKYNSKQINFYQIVGGTLGLTLLLPIYLSISPTAYIIPNVRDSIYLLMLSLFCTVGLYYLFAEALKRIPAFTVNLSFNLEPIYSIILAFILFDEAKEVNEYFYIGLVLVMTSVVLQSIITISKRKKGLI